SGNRLLSGALPPSLALLEEPTRLHEAADRRVRWHRARARVGLELHRDIVEVQLEGPSGVVLVRLGDQSPNRIDHARLGTDVLADPALQRFHRVLRLVACLIVPALDRRLSKPYGFTCRRMAPSPLGQPLEFQRELAGRWGRG